MKTCVVLVPIFLNLLFNQLDVEHKSANDENDITSGDATQTSANEENDINASSAESSVGDFKCFNILKYFHGYGWYKGCVTKSRTNDDGTIDYHVYYAEDDDAEYLNESEVEKLRKYEQMDPQPRGPLIDGVSFTNETHEAGITEEKSSKAEDETAASDSIDTERQSADQNNRPRVHATHFQNDESENGSVPEAEFGSSHDHSDETKDVSVEIVSNSKVSDESRAIVVHSAPLSTIGETVASSCNSNLHFTNNYLGLSSLPDMNKEHGLQNDSRVVAITNNGATISVHSQHSMRQARTFECFI